jgi:hypothetical protein
MDQLQLLKQQTSVDNYIDSYETWMTQMKRDRAYLPQDFFVDRFVSGLKQSIKHHVHCQKPTDLLSAYWYARQYEKAYLSSVKQTVQGLLGQRTVPPPARPAALQENRNRAPVEQRNRAPRRCWYYPENWSVGHKCAPIQ